MKKEINFLNNQGIYEFKDNEDVIFQVNKEDMQFDVKLFYNAFFLHYYTIALIDTIGFSISIASMIFLRRTHRIKLSTFIVTSYFEIIKSNYF